MATLTTAQKNSLNAASKALGNVASQLKAKQASGQKTVKLTDTVNLGGGSGSNGKKYTSSSNAITQATEALAPTVAEVQKTGQYFTLPKGYTGAPITPTFKTDEIGTKPPSITPYYDTVGQQSDAFAFSTQVPDATPEQQLYDRIAKQKLDRAEKLSQFDLGREQSRAEQAQGIPQMRSQLNDLNVQIAQKQGEYNKLFNTAENKAIPTPFIIGEQNEIKKTAAIEIGMLTATAQALQGNIQAAQSIADRAVDLKYKTIQSQIQAYDTQLETIKPYLDRQEKKAAEAIQAQNKQRSDENALKLDLSKTANDKIAEGTSNGAPYSAYSKAYQQVQDGDPAGAIATMSPWTKEETVSVGDDAPLYSGLSSQTATAVRSKVSAFKTEPSVQNFDTVQEGYNFAKSLSNKTTNPADDQALIYALAKILDPGSVVREGEYATAQKYAQSWIAAYGKGITQAINGTGFLSETARKNIKNTIESRYLSRKSSYDNVQSRYISNINSLTGRGDGSKFLIDYSYSVTPKSTTSSGNTYTTSDETPDVLEGADYEVIQY